MDESLLDAFASYLVGVLGLSEKTARNYRQAARALLVWLARERPGLSLDELRTRDVDDYLISVAARRLQPSTRYGYVYGVKAFLAFVASRGGATSVSVRPPKVPPVRVDIYSSAEADAVVAGALTSDAPVHRQRHAMISTLRYTGVRSGELRALRLDHLDLGARRLEVLGKGSRPRLLPVPEPLAEVLGEFLADVRPALPDSPLVFANPHPFVRHPQRQVSEEALEWAVRRAGAAAGVPGRHYPHRFRHTYATELVRAGVSVAMLQRLLGHVSVTSTILYTHLADDDLREAVDGVYGRCA